METKEGFYVVTRRADELCKGDTVLPYGKELWCCYPYIVTKVGKVNRRRWTINVGFSSSFGEGEPFHWNEEFITNHIFAVVT